MKNLSADFQQRIDKIDEALMTVKDPARRSKLTQRLANLKQKQAMQQKAALGKQAAVAMRLQKVDRLLSQTEERRETLAKRKAHLESLMAAGERDTEMVDKVDTEMVAKVETDEVELAPQKPGIRLVHGVKNIDRVIHIEQRLSSPKISEEKRQKLARKLTILKGKQHQKPANQMAFEDRIKNVESRLADPETNDQQRKALTRRLAMLKQKQDAKSSQPTNLDERVKHIEQRLGNPNMPEQQRQKLAHRLLMFKAKQQKPAQQMTVEDRVKQMESRLEDPETNDQQRKVLARRLAMLKHKLQAKPRQPVSPEDRVKHMEQRLANPNTPEKQRQKLAHRLSIVKAKQQKPAQQMTLEDHVKHVESRLADPETNDGHRKKLALRLSMLKRKQQANLGRRVKLEERVKHIEQLLANPDTPERKRQNLTQRLSILKAQQQGKDAGVEMKALQGNMLQQRVERVEARLAKDDLNPEERDQLQERLTFLRAKLENKGIRKHEPAGSNRSNLEQRLKRQEQLLEQKNLDQGRRQEVEHRVACMRAKLQNQERRGLGGGVNLSVRARNQKRLIGLEQRARETGDEAALTRIALQEVYVAHYPTEDGEEGSLRKYIPLCAKQVKKKAAMRQKALELARSEPGADWIAPDQYERLPDHWTVEDEIAMFGKGKKWKKFAPTKRDDEEDDADDAYDLVDNKKEEDIDTDFEVLMDEEAVYRDAMKDDDEAMKDDDEAEGIGDNYLNVEVDDLDFVGVETTGIQHALEEGMKVDE
eukprot:CAMPEP_0117029944 /NCGR_PEP_ID=MMETSP0472-20121206/21636_1 /TAXON_ID=693140 ORGANISM="Tiarina fusus, Strain LIS" /NCGR_SAMPLE_ID=MMETSP0472 /ASSEMBLY_ACC=CAM_ASM_000603 /LENGTH=761 /DNA_ID=CAMNT_0004737843 /DNA_START=33 /DNA_END=2318 /DNA_ORIENTATION=-